MIWDRHAPRGKYRKRITALGSSPRANEVAEDKWRPTDWLDDRSCLFCSRPLTASQTRCQHCGSLAL